MCGRKRESEQGEAGGRKVREERRERLCGGGESARESQTDRQKKVRKEICMSSSNRLVPSTAVYTAKLQCS